MRSCASLTVPLPSADWTTRARPTHSRRRPSPLCPPLAPLPVQMAAQVATMGSNGHHHSVELLSFDCRSEGGDASKGIDDTVMTARGASGTASAGTASERVTLKRKPNCTAEPGHSPAAGYLNKRIALLIRKEPRPLPSDEQVHWAQPVCAVWMLRVLFGVPYCAASVKGRS
jgi:hypothetical protein